MKYFFNINGTPLKVIFIYNNGKKSNIYKTYSCLYDLIEYMEKSVSKYSDAIEAINADTNNTICKRVKLRPFKKL